MDQFKIFLDNYNTVWKTYMCKHEYQKKYGNITDKEIDDHNTLINKNRTAVYSVNFKIISLLFEKKNNLTDMDNETITKYINEVINLTEKDFTYVIRN